MFHVNSVDSNQHQIHRDLLKLVAKHDSSTFLRPFAEHTMHAFDKFAKFAETNNKKILIDACCGVGESTLHLAKKHPDCLVVGIDKSIARLEKNQSYQACLNQPGDNVLLVRADLHDFWRLLSESKYKHRIKRQFIFYPNPYPKKSQLSKRWYAGPVMKSIVDACPNIECRSNWLLYLEEFQQALLYFGIHSKIVEISSTPITPFERKYMESNQRCWKIETIEN